jgi:hypothetical protein
MNLESLQKGDVIYITNSRGEQHTADFLEFTQEGVYINFKGFGHLEVKWADLLSIKHVTKAQQIDNSYGPRYKVTLWQA